MFYPPVKNCTNPECALWKKGSLFKKVEQHAVIAFTLTNGVHPAWSVHLKCHCTFDALLASPAVSLIMTPSMSHELSQQL